MSVLSYWAYRSIRCPNGPIFSGREAVRILTMAPLKAEVMFLLDSLTDSDQIVNFLRLLVSRAVSLFFFPEINKYLFFFLFFFYFSFFSPIFSPSIFP